MARFTYSAGYDGSGYHEPDNRFDFPAGQRTYGEDWDLVATDLAEDFADHHDGWESSWPLQIRIYDHGQEIGRFEVEREFEPVYRASEIDLPSAALSPKNTESEHD